MSSQQSRRRFLSSVSAGGAVAMTSQFGFFSSLPRVSADDAQLPAGLVQFSPEIEPLVHLIETTSRDRLLEEMGHRIQRGASYREVLAALFLAGIRNVQPRPAVGFKFHSVLCINSCHLTSLSGPAEDRWLPIFWALDYFKSAQADEARSSGWKMPAVKENLIPDAMTSRRLFTEAMDQWDEEKADLATAGLARTAGAVEAFELLAQYAARDFRSIGHKAIYLANAWRTLQVIGWEFAEPVLRSLTYAILNREGSQNPAENDYAADRPWRKNAELVEKIPENWLNGKLDDSAVPELIATFRQANAEESAQLGADLLSKGIAPQTLWDAVFVGGGELLMQQPGIVALHSLTSANAIHQIWQQVGDETLRKRLLLQACAFNGFFHQAARGRGNVSSVTFDSLEPASDITSGAEAVQGIMRELSHDKRKAATQMRGYLAAGGSPYELIHASRRVLFEKGNNSHDYKFSAAVLEDYHAVSPAWRDQFLALSAFNLRGSEDRENQLVKRTRSALS